MKIRLQKPAVDGEVSDVLDEYRKMVEKFRGMKIWLEERRNASFLVELLKAALAQTKEGWLLCLENADDSNWGGILDTVCEIPEPERDNNWILGTSWLECQQYGIEWKSVKKLWYNRWILLWFYGVILKVIKDENESISTVFYNAFVKKLVHGSSLIYREEGEKMPVQGMYRLVRLLFLATWSTVVLHGKNAFSVGIISLNEGLEGVLA